MSDIRTLITRWRDDAGGTYRSWFLWEQRLKNFRAIRRGILEVVAEIEQGTFGNVYKGSSLEIAVGAIAEQRQTWIVSRVGRAIHRRTMSLTNFQLNSDLKWLLLIPSLLWVIGVVSLTVLGRSDR